MTGSLPIAAARMTGVGVAGTANDWLLGALNLPRVIDDAKLDKRPSLSAPTHSWMALFPSKWRIVTAHSSTLRPVLGRPA